MYLANPRVGEPKGHFARDTVSLPASVLIILSSRPAQQVEKDVKGNFKLLDYQFSKPSRKRARFPNTASKDPEKPLI